MLHIQKKGKADYSAHLFLHKVVGHYCRLFLGRRILLVFGKFYFGENKLLIFHTL